MLGTFALICVGAANVLWLLQQHDIAFTGSNTRGAERVAGGDDTVLINLIRYIKLYKKLQDKIEHDDIIKNNFKTDECCVCLSTNPEVIFVPCAHLCSCMECGQQLSKCPLCRRQITNRINVN